MEPRNDNSPSPRRPKTISRRGFLKGAVGVAATIVVAEKKFGISEKLFKAPASEPFRENEVPRFQEIPDINTVERVEDWNADRLKQELEEAVEASIRENRHIVVELPPGEIFIDKKVSCVVREGSSISLEGNGLSHLKLDPRLSDIPKEWDSSERNNLLAFTDVEGTLTIDGVTFNGGSVRSGKGGYAPPGGPWDAVLSVTGSGPGSGKFPERERMVKSRKGSVVISNCKFYNTESAACYTRNLGYAEVKDCEGKNFDAIWCVSWCDKFVGKNIRGQNSLSDVFAFYVCDKGELVNCQAKSARQGILFQGTQNVTARDCYVEDCGKAYDMYKDGDRNDPCSNISLENCDSRGSGYAYAFDYTNNVRVVNGVHDEMGTWLVRDDFLRTGINRPEEFWRVPDPFWFGTNNKNLTFDKIQMRKSREVKEAYQEANGRHHKGIQTVQF